MSRVIHFFNYLEYDDLYNIGFKFNKPTKNSLNTYIATLKRPIFFILPNSEVYDIFQDNFSTNMFKYMINIEEHSEFVSFLENLDSICINVASENSELWFKKQLESKTLVKHYNQIYLSNSEYVDTLTCNIEIKNNDHLVELSDYNDSENTNLMVCIEGIEFYKQTFKWKITLESLIENLSDSEESEDESIEPDLDFNSILDTQNKPKNNTVVKKVLVDVPVFKPLSIPITSALALPVVIKKNIDTLSISESHSQVINKEVIDDLADMDISDKQISELNKLDYIDTPKPLIDTKVSEIDLESIISQKKIDARKYLINAERAKKAADSLSKKAIETNNELKKYEERLLELSQTSSILSKKY